MELSERKWEGMGWLYFCGETYRSIFFTLSFLRSRKDDGVGPKGCVCSNYGPRLFSECGFLLLTAVLFRIK